VAQNASHFCDLPTSTTLQSLSLKDPHVFVGFCHVFQNFWLSSSWRNRCSYHATTSISKISKFSSDSLSIITSLGPASNPCPPSPLPTPPPPPFPNP